MHRHKMQNAHRHAAPSEIPVDAIQRGEVIRMVMAKNSYAKRIMEPFYVWHNRGAIQFIEALDPDEAQRASADIPTASEAAKQQREDAAHERFMQIVRTAEGPQTPSAYMQLTGLSRTLVARHAARAVQEGMLSYDGKTYTSITPAVSAAYGF